MTAAACRPPLLLLLLWACIVGGKVVFITYGDDSYSNSRDRIMKEAAYSKWFDDIQGYARADAEQTVQSLMPTLAAPNQERFKEIFNAQRGGGYWLWKPLLLQKMLGVLKEGDVLMYADAGCTFNFKQHKDFRNQLEAVKKGKGLVACDDLQKAGCEDCVDADFSKPAALAAVFPDEKERQQVLGQWPGQIESGRIWVRKGSEGEAVINEWASLALAQPDLFLDVTKEEMAVLNATNAGFKEHRHDQSILSLLVKKHQAKSSTCSCILPTRRREADLQRQHVHCNKAAAAVEQDLQQLQAALAV